MAPVAGAMAGFALAAVATGVLIIVPVAIVTSSTQLDPVKLAGMAGIAMYGTVGTRQFEFRILVVVEDEFLPFLFVMAFFAFLAVAPCMDVIYTVTGHTFPGQIFISLVGMAAITCRLLVLAVERDFGFVVVKAASLPGSDAVALFALLA
jgi:hypothetical protein